MELCTILFSTVDQLTALTKWPALPFICNFCENKCNKFNCWDFKLSNDVNTVHVAAIWRKLQQQEKVSEYLCTPPKRDLLPRWQSHRVCVCSPWVVKNASKNACHFSIFVPLTGVQILFGGKCVSSKLSYSSFHVQYSRQRVDLNVWGWIFTWNRSLRHKIECIR